MHVLRMNVYQFCLSINLDLEYVHNRNNQEILQADKLGEPV